MHATLLKPRKALNKAFLKLKPNRSEIEVFKTNLISLLDSSNETESEEFHKNLVSDFLKDTYYKQSHFINTKGRNDLVIHNGNKASDSVGVILETKKPTNKAEMPSPQNVNVKAFQELVLYYMRERITHKNLEVKHLVISNLYEWYIFDAMLFDRLFAQNKSFVKQFQDFEAGRLAEIKTDFFYKQIAEPFIAGIEGVIESTYFNLQDYQKTLRNADKADDNLLIALFKLLSPEHLLKLPFANDSNSLDKKFYNELLHIIGLEESKEGGKKLIQRNKEGHRNSGSMLEDAIIQLDSMDKISRLERASQFGVNYQERLFNVAMELCITWINRILFLKLLEAQLKSYHRGDKLATGKGGSDYLFLNSDKIKNYDDLNTLFFQVLARKQVDRNEDVKKHFEKVPYLNSSLFEPTEIEHATLFISNLRDDKTLPVYSQTVLKDTQGRKLNGEQTTLDYFFRFLEAYDFGAEGGEEIQEDNKTLINASVLGLIFEKINGYKDGSFFTPGFITMYMCRETIRKSVVSKFKEKLSENPKLSNSTSIESMEDIYELIPSKITRTEANKIVNDIKICDPAVGSGHFLVTALNEMIAVKNDLKILEDKDGKTLNRYEISVVNDELVVTDEDGELFEYNPNNKESQRVQETLFQEKQTIIENCLFGVDINPNSVKICRLRLWIELLKNAYYNTPIAHGQNHELWELETLPNIDINIKCGNSLVSRFGLDADLKKALKKSKWNMDSYKSAVATYRNAKDKEQKREMERLIADIKSDFRTEINANDPKLNKLYILRADLTTLTTQTDLFEKNKKEKAVWNKKVEKLSIEIKKLESEIEEIKANKIFENAFEWRFEFPEVLDNEGGFVGFDVVIGNPPYGVDLKNRDFYKSLYPETSFGQIDTYKYFIQLGLLVLKNEMWFSFITSDSYLEKEYFKDLRELITNNSSTILNIKLGDSIFEEVNLPTSIIQLQKGKTEFPKFYFKDVSDKDRNNLNLYSTDLITESPEYLKQFSINNSIINTFDTLPLIELYEQVMGVKVYQIGKGKPKQTSFEIENNTFISSEKKSAYHLPFISQGIKRYYYESQDEFIKYGEWLAEPRDIKYFSNNKIVVREIINPRIFACLIDYEAVVKNIAAVIIQKSNDFKLDFLLGLLNSKLMTFYVFQQTPKSSNKSYPSFNSRLLKSIPIKSGNLQIRNQIGNKALEVHQLKRDNSEADTTALEAEIDQLVYELYELTEEEIKIIENA